MAKKKGSRRRKSKPTIPLAIVAGFVPGGRELVIAGRVNFPDHFLRVGTRIYTGFDPLTQVWRWSNMKNGTFPILGGLVVHAAANFLGVNRMIARAKIPFLRI